MEKQNKQLLDEVIKFRLERVLTETKDEGQSFDEAMKAIDRKIEIAKIESANNKTESELEAKQREFEEEIRRTERELELKTQELALKEREIEVKRQSVQTDMWKVDVEASTAEAELEARRKESRRNMVIKIIEIGGIIILAPIIEGKIKTSFAKLMCDFERDYTFTTTAGRSLSGLFKFKK